MIKISVNTKKNNMAMTKFNISNRFNAYGLVQIGQEGSETVYYFDFDNSKMANDLIEKIKTRQWQNITVLHHFHVVAFFVKNFDMDFVVDLINSEKKYFLVHDIKCIKDVLNNIVPNDRFVKLPSKTSNISEKQMSKYVETLYPDHDIIIQANSDHEYIFRLSVDNYESLIQNVTFWQLAEKTEQELEQKIQNMEHIEK